LVKIVGLQQMRHFSPTFFFYQYGRYSYQIYIFAFNKKNHLTLKINLRRDFTHREEHFIPKALSTVLIRLSSTYLSLQGGPEK
jgi:hypothetical protein